MNRCLQRKQKVISVIFIQMALVGFFCLSFLSKSYAISVAPTLLELRILPGGKYVTGFKVTNNTAVKKRIGIELEPWAQTEKTYPGRSFDWIRFKPSSVVLEGGKSATFECTIELPKGTKDEKMVMAFAGELPDEAKGVVARTRISVPIYAAVKGYEVVSGTFQVFSMEGEGFTKEGDYKILSIAPSFRNNGNVHLRPMVMLSIADLDANLIDNLVRDDRKRKEMQIMGWTPVFPYSSRKTDMVDLKLPLIVGRRYQAIFDVRFGEFYEQEKVQKQVIDFYVNEHGVVVIGKQK